MITTESVLAANNMILLISALIVIGMALTLIAAKMPDRSHKKK